MLSSTANRLVLASCLKPDIRAVSAAGFGAQHLFTCLVVPRVLHRRYQNVDRNAETTPKGLAANFSHARFPKATSKSDCL